MAAQCCSTCVPTGPCPQYLLILASQSPRRQEFLQWLEIPYLVVPSHIEEKSGETDPARFALDLATQKGRAVYLEIEKNNPDAWGYSLFPFVVSADTIVVIDQEILGRPRDAAHAKEMLAKLSGRTHQVITAVAFHCLDHQSKQMRTHSFAVTTQVHFNVIDEDLMENYLETGDSLDKAGAYGIQAFALTFIDRIEGSYANVVGLPLSDLIVQLKHFLGYANDTKGHWRHEFSHQTFEEQRGER